MPVVVLGSGIIGLSTAYFLSLPPGHLSSSSLQPPPPKDWQPPQIHLVDPSPELFHITASGLAGGFLAKDWFAPPVAPLGAFSFDLHRKLAQACRGKEKWGWCETEGWSLDRDKDSEEAEVDEGFSDSGVEGVKEDFDLSWLMSGSSRATLLAEVQAQAGDGAPPAQSEGMSTQEEAGTHPKWIRAQPTAFQPIADRKSTAQVDPMRLCHFLLSECLARGVKLHSPARATQLVPSSSSSPSQIRIEYLDTASPSHPHPHSGELKTVDIPCDSLILTSGAWTPQIFRTLFPTAQRVPRVNPLAGYSILFKSPSWTPIPPEQQQDRVCHAIFTSDPAAGFSLEMFSRAGGECWLGGLNAKHLALPAVPTPLSLITGATNVTAEEAEKAIETLKGIARKLCKTRPRSSSPSSSSSPNSSPGTRHLEITRTSLCFRPVSPTGRPIIAQVPSSDLYSESSDLGGLKVFLGTAHGPWGISLSLGTGWVLSEMVRGEKTSVDVGALGQWEASEI